MEEPSEDSLSSLDKYMTRISNGQLHINLLYSVDNKPYLAMWTKYPSRDFNFTPSFHLIGTVVTSHTFQLKLESFQGTILDEQTIDVTSGIGEDSDFRSLVTSFCSGKLRLCRGIERNPDSKLSLLMTSSLLDQILIERLECDIVLRSRNCKIALVKNDNDITECSDDVTTQCSECKNLKSSIVGPGNVDQHSDLNDEPFHLVMKVELGQDEEEKDKLRLVKKVSSSIKTFKSNRAKRKISQKVDKTLQDSLMPFRAEPSDVIDKLQGPLEEDLLEPKSEPLINDVDEEMSEEQKCSKCGQFGHVTKCGCENVEKEKKTKLRHCLKCGKKFKRILKFRQHLKESPACNETFKSNRIIVKKEEIKDEDKESRSCENCGDEFEGFEMLMQHFRESSSCEEAFQVSDHKANLKKGPKFKKKICDTCHQEFHGINNFMKHLKLSKSCKEVFKSRTKKVASTTNSTYYLNKGGFLCPICGKNYSCPSALDIHMGCMHGVDSDGKTPVEQHVCDICGNSYGHKLRLKEHIFIYHKNGKLKCDQCDKVFHVQNKLVTHQVAYHLKIRPFKCPECDYEASEMSNVYKHCQKHHGYRAKSKDVRIDFEKLEIIRQKLNYNYFGKTAESVKNKEKD